MLEIRARWWRIAAAGLKRRDVGSYGGSSLSMTRFGTLRSALCGVHLARGGELDLSEGELRGQPIGACIQVEGYDTDRLTDRVRYVDNAVNLHTTNLLVPEPSEVLPDVP